MIQKYNKSNYNKQKYSNKNQDSNKQYYNKSYNNNTTEKNFNNSKQTQQKTQQEKQQPQTKEDIITLLQDILQELKYIKGKLTVFKNNKPISLAESINSLLQYLVPQEEEETISEEEMKTITR